PRHYCPSRTDLIVVVLNMLRVSDRCFPVLPAPTSISPRSPTTPSAHRPTPPSSAWAATVHDCPPRSRWYRGVPGTATRCASSASPPTSTRVPSTSTSTVWAPMRTKYFTAPPAFVSSRRLQDRHGLHLRRL